MFAALQRRAVPWLLDDQFLAHHLDRSTADHVLTVTQSLGPLQRQREIEAYALQSQTGMVESLLTRHC